MASTPPNAGSFHGSTPLEHLEGMPPYLMMLMVARLKVRIVEVLGAEESSERIDEIAHHVLYRLMEKRMSEGKQFDSILEASRAAFAKAMFFEQLKRDAHEPRG